MSRDELQQLQAHLAYTQARMDLESFCVARAAHPGLPWWFDTARVDKGCEAFVERSVRYLSLAGLLIRHPTQPHLVQVKDWPDAG